MSFAGKHLVIFGCGYVGSAVAERALWEGMRVTGLTRNPATADTLQRTGIDVVAAALESDMWHARIPTADFVVNAVSAADATAEGYRKSYIEGAQSILRWAKSQARPVDTLVYTSSTGVYPQDNGIVVDETAPSGATSPTAEILLEAEQLFLSATPSPIRRAVVLRLAGIYGPGRHSILDQLRAGAASINGRGGHRLNLIHRDDIVAAVFATFTARTGTEVFNLSDGNPAAKRDFVAWLCAQLGRPPPQFDSHAPSIRRGGAGVPDRIIDNAKARQLLGWTPRHPDFRSGYAEILRSSTHSAANGTPPDDSCTQRNKQ